MDLGSDYFVAHLDLFISKVPSESQTKLYLDDDYSNGTTNMATIV